MSTYIPNEFTRATVKSTTTLRQLADIDESAGSRDRIDNIRNNQILVSLVNINRPRTFSFQYISDLLQGGTGISISTGKDGVAVISVNNNTNPDLEALMIAYAVAL